MHTQPRTHTISRLLIFLLLTFITAAGAPAAAQMPIHLSVSPSIEPDSADVARLSKPHFWRASATVVGLNTGLWAFDRFVLHGDYAYISPRTMLANLRHGFKWDNDRMETNMFLHPYNGSLFYNAGRANGYSFWGSSLFALAGSAQWELMMEKEYPSTNDIIATPIGGMAIGEVTYRISDIILDDRSWGWERFGREAGSFLISPVRGLTRLIDGDATTRRLTSGRRFGIPDIGLEFSVGARVLSFGNRGTSDNRLGGTLELNLEYGNRFDSRRMGPYDYFTLRGALAFGKREPVLSQLNIKGRLMATELRDNPSSKLSLGLYQHFDYYDTDTLSAHTDKCPYKLAVPASIGGGLLYRHSFTPGTTADAFFHANAVILGGILSDHYLLDERNYNLASGFSVKAGAHFVLGHDRLAVSLSHELYSLYTWNGYDRGTDLSRANRRTLNSQGDNSNAIFGVTDLNVNLRVAPRLYFTMGLTHYLRTTHYRDYPDLSSAALAARVMLTYKL